MIALLLMLILGALHGRVTSSSAGVPVTNAVLSIESLDLRAATDAHGRFRLDGVPTGRWAVLVEADGFATRELIVRVSDGTTVNLDVILTPLDPAVPTHRLRGRVRGEGRLEAVPFALVEIEELQRRTETDAAGTFSFDSLPAGSWTLRVSAAGYRPSTVPVRISDSNRLDVRLAPDPLPLDGVLVRGERMIDMIRRDAPEARVVDAATMERVPVAVEMDLMRVVQTMPSATPSSDYSSALFVRGGTPDQTRILLDGAQIHNPFHIGGFVSAFNPAAMSGAVLRPGGLPASSPSSLSGTLEVHAREGSRDSTNVGGAIGLLSSSATVDGPLGGSGSYLISARRNYIDLGTGLIRRLGLIRESFPYQFSDVLGRVRLDLGSRGVLTATAYRDAEQFRNAFVDGQLDADWASDVLSLRARSLLGAGFLGEAAVSTSGFGGDFFMADKISPDCNCGPPDTTQSRSSLRTFAADVSLRKTTGAHTLSTGARWERTSVDHALDEIEDVMPDLGVYGVYSTTSFWLQNRVELGSGWQIHAGLRTDQPDGRAWHLLPRGRIDKSFGERLAFAVSGGRYVQNWWSLRNEESLLSYVFAYDLTMPTPTTQPLARGWDAVIEARTRVGNWELRVDAYHKQVHGVTTARVPPEPDVAVLLHPDSIRTGEGMVRGVEVAAAGQLAGADVAISYRWQRERRTLDGMSFLPRTDRTHRAVITAAIPWGERQVAAALTWMSGQPYTPVKAILPNTNWVDPSGRSRQHVYGTERVIFDAPNSARLPGYLRLDVDFRGDWGLTMFGKRGQLEPYVSILNVLNEHNALVTWVDGLGGQKLRKLGPQLPLLPSFGVRWQF